MVTVPWSIFVMALILASKGYVIGYELFVGVCWIIVGMLYIGMVACRMLVKRIICR